MILAIDQGTSSTKATLFDPAGQPIANASAAIKQTHPHPGWVEQDATEILTSVRTVIAEVAAKHEIEAVALSTQRESVVVWERATGEPAAPMLGWQDRRTASRARDLVGHAERVKKLTGLPLDPMFSALKLGWLLDQVDPDRTRTRRGELALGTVDSWLVARLTGEYRIEAGNASRTQLLDLGSGSWSSELCELFAIPEAALPEVVASDLPTAELSDLPECRILSVLGDSHAALYGHGVRSPGIVKATYGTGSSVMGLASDLNALPEGLAGTIAWRLGSQDQLAFEGNILASGATVAWLSRLLNRSIEELATLARMSAPTVELVLVPAMAGLGAPYWDPEAQAVLVGFDLGTDPAALARAGMEAIAHQIVDVLDEIGSIDTVLVDGAPAADDFLMSLQADFAQCRVSRPRLTGLSGRGTAQLAATRLGYEFTPLESDHFSPRSDAAAARSAWRHALTLTRKEK